MTKVLFVYPNVGKTLQIPMGIAYISSYLKRSGIHTFLWDGTFQDPNTLGFSIKLLQPDIVCFSALSPDYDFVLKLAKSIRKKYDKIPFVIGGYHATFCPNEVFNTGIFDRVIVGEAEYALMNYIEGCKEGYKIYGKLADVNEIPWPDHEMFKEHFSKKISWSDEKYEKTGVVLTSRGCPFSCTYCSCNALKQLYGPGITRFRDIDDVINEIVYITGLYGLDNIWFTDETLTINKKRIIELCKKYKDRVGIPFSIETRPDTVNEEVLLALKDAGCTMIRMGIESGVDRIRNGLYGRNIDRQDIIHIFLLAKKIGLKTSSFNIAGAPTETIDDIEETIYLNQQCEVDTGKMTLFNVFPGTKMWDYCKDHGYKIKKKYPENYYEDSNFVHESLSIKQLTQMTDKFNTIINGKQGI